MFKGLYKIRFESKADLLTLSNITLSTKPEPS